MKTDDLIQALSADGQAAGMPMDRAWMLAVGAAIVLAAVAFFAMLGMRPDIASAMETVRFLFKFVVTGVLAGSALAVIQAASRPEGMGRKTLGLLALAPALLVGGIVLEMMVMPTDQWVGRLVGNNYLLCMTFIPLIGLAPLVVFLAVLRHGAPARPGLAGAVAGIFAGGVAATFYAAHCADDSPMFVATWYSLAIALLAVVGAVGGRILARW
ncbi:MAG: NrsF family protein [Rhizobiaceae bacterium]